MGRAKELFMEIEKHGYDYLLKGEKYLCAHHFRDKYLNGYIDKSGKTGVCSYCGRKESVIDMTDFKKHIYKVVLKYFDDLDAECMPLASSYFEEDDEHIPGIKRVGSYAVPTEADVYEDISEFVNDLELYTDNDDLNNDIDNIFNDRIWIKKNPFERWWNEEKELQWRRFSYMVMHLRRFTFLAQQAEYSEDNILESIGRVLCNTNAILHSIATGTIIYRTRSFDKKPNGHLEFTDITSAPDKYAGQCRMSPAGVSMFYGAYDKNTAIQECIKLPNAKVLAIGKFTTKCELTVVDLTKLPTDFSIWMDHWQEVSFLNSFHKDITQPLSNEVKEKIDYVPSQIFTEYLRWMFVDKDGNNIHGFIYRSNKTSKANIVLFCNNNDSHEWMELESSTFENINNIFQK